MLSPCLAFSSWHLISSTTGTLSSPHHLSQCYPWSQACFSTLFYTHALPLPGFLLLAPDI